MRVVNNFGWKIALIAVVISLALMPAYAKDMSMDNSQQNQSAELHPAVTGAGGLPTAVASNATNNAFLYTGDIRTCNPEKATGDIQMGVVDGSANDIADTRDKATVVADFVGADGAKYNVRFTCISPVGPAGTTHFGGVGLQKQVFGSTNVGGGLGLPQTMAYIVAFGNIDIKKDGNSLAEGQQAIALVTDAIHNPDGAWLTCSDPSRQEIHLLAPGSLMTGGTAVCGFPNGYFYIYWPDASYQINNTGSVNLGQIAEPKPQPEPVGRGPSLCNTASQEVNQLTINITDNAIEVSNESLKTGPYEVTIVNDSQCTRGLLMKGRDVACSPFIRFNQVLDPGEKTTFRWYFAPGEVTLKDFTCASHFARSLTDVSLGGLDGKVVFQ